MKPKLTKEELSELTEKSDLVAWSDFLIHASLLVFVGWLFQLAWYDGRWIDRMATWLIYSCSFAFLGYAGLGHALSHRKVFKSNDMNDWLFWAVSILTWRNAFYFSAGHETHHSHPLQKGLDDEVDPKPSGVVKDWWKYLFFDYNGFHKALKVNSLNALGIIRGPLAKTVFKSSSHKKQEVVMFARAILAFHVIVFLYSLAHEMYWLIVLINLGAFGFTWPSRILTRLQHEGMSTNTQDCTLSTRTVILPRWLSFLSWNMNYHIEHRWYPSVPYYRLPDLHNKVSEYNKESTLKGIAECLRELK